LYPLRNEERLLQQIYLFISFLILAEHLAWVIKRLLKLYRHQDGQLLQLFVDDVDLTHRHFGVVFRGAGP
jgi:hypothetical protein